MGKKSKHSKVSNILGEVEIHTIPKMWEKWIPIVRKKYEKTNISKLSISQMFFFMQKSMQFPKHGKSGFPLYGRSMEKHKHFKFMGFLNISDEAEIHTIPRIWEKWISIIREKYGKKQTFQSNEFLHYFEWSRNPYNSQNMEKVNFHSKRKIWENTNIPK